MNLFDFIQILLVFILIGGLLFFGYMICFDTLFTEKTTKLEMGNLKYPQDFTKINITLLDNEIYDSCYISNDNTSYICFVAKNWGIGVASYYNYNLGNYSK